MLKSVEAVAKLISDTLKTELKSSPVMMVGAALSRPAFNKLRKMISPEEIGAALLLGIDGLVFVGHGRSNATALVSAIRLAQQTADTNLLDEMRKDIQEQAPRFESINPAA
jgi:glycerol-3-phosphate acyltransferase PlsX